ncbi:MAG: helix-turn-helix domain-containing protein [Ignavibacteria bacterium]|nr:helix-turn-helix domain-containing protein [Ignavibacteria bacterium]
MILSSKKAAEFLNVNESTVKRWADNGKLKSFKTPGGHRKFKFEDLKKVSEENNYLTPDMSAYSISIKTFNEIKDRDYGSLNKKFGKYLLKGDTGASYDLIYLLYLDKVPVAQIFDEVVKQSMENIGDLWSKGLLGIEDEHIASGALLSVIHRFENDITDKYYSKSKKFNKTALCTGLENQLHDIGLLCVKITLKHLGWKVIYPGSNLPENSIINLLKIEKPDLLCLSFKSHGLNGKLIKVSSEIMKTADKLNIKIFTGGEAAENGSNGVIKINDMVTFTKHLKELKQK